MSTFPSGVTIVTTTDRRGVPHGLTCSSLCSVSLDPPLLLVCIHNGSGTLVTIRDRGVFAVNILHGDGKEAAEAFASRSLERFARVPWRPTLHWSLPHLFAHAHAIAECRVAQAVVAGDHTIVIGEVVNTAIRTDAPPLLHGLRQYALWPGTVPGRQAHTSDPNVEPCRGSRPSHQPSILTAKCL
jgi:flavin reductase (DIM6/NTAB) family NADH-FMN oxidoreductase RutF